MYWNHRVIYNGHTKMYGIHEVFYKEDQTIWMWISKPTKMIEESIEDLNLTLKYFKKTLKQPVLVENKAGTKLIERK